MSKDPLYEHFLEISWQRALTPAEQARLGEWLAKHPEFDAEWEAESGLNRALEALPNMQVPSNFTARVLDEARRIAVGGEQVQASRRLPWWSRWLPRTSVAAVVVAAGLLSYHHLQESRREEVAQSLTTLSQIPAVPGPEVLKDFDTIAALDSTPPADEELLKVMQ
jgi:ferric-dicitrate binding protein FerR (iron transport regulator)